MEDRDRKKDERTPHYRGEGETVQDADDGVEEGKGGGRDGFLEKEGPVRSL